MDLLKLEQQRQALETSLQSLRQSLKHWQTWEAEYEGLKEEIQHIDGDLTTSTLTEVAKAYDGELVNETEVRELVGLDKDVPRTAKQIIGLIERRQEYVQKNIDTIQRQFFDAEAKSEELAFAAASQSSADQSGLPLTEIHEELDDDGNVISSRLSQPEEATAKVVESLRNAGLSEADLENTPESKPRSEDLKPAIINASPSITPAALNSGKQGSSDYILASPASDATQDGPGRPPLRKKSVSFAADTKAAIEPLRPESEDGAKKVSFAEKVAVMPAAPPPDPRSVSFSPQVEEIPLQPLGPASPYVQATPVQPIEKTLEDITKNSDETAEEDTGQSSSVVVPEDESPEDAQTRREMLEFHLNEVGNVVAQMDLDEADVDMGQDDEDDDLSYHTTSEYLEDDDTPYTTGLSESEEESEDNFGRSKRPQVTPEYRKQMEELEQRLIGNLGPAPKIEDVEEVDADLDPKDVHRLVIRNKRTSTSSASSDNSEKKTGNKKRVSFAESLDVAEPGSPPLKAQKLQEPENVAPVTETISERTTAVSHSLPTRSGAERVSQCKNNLVAPVTPSQNELSVSAGSAIAMDDTDEAPSGPPGVIIADTLQERTAIHKPATAPSSDPDDVMRRRELAEAYYRRRNEMIRQQGGFKGTADDDEDQGELMEENDGKARKVSRFKAARIKS